MRSADSRSAGASDEGNGAVCAESCAPPTRGRRGRVTKGTVGLVQNHALRRLEVGGGERRRGRVRFVQNHGLRRLEVGGGERRRGGCGLCRIMRSADSRSAGASDEGDGGVSAESCAPPTRGRRGRATKGTVRFVQNHVLRRLEVGGGERRRGRWG